MKSNVLVSVFLAIMIFLVFTGCDMGNGNIIRQERVVGEFTSVALDGIGNVNIYPKENKRVVVTTDSNLQDIVSTKVVGDTLYITQRSGLFNANELTIDVYLPELTRISLNGTGNFSVKNGNATELTLLISGTGNINAQNFQVKNINITHSGVGNARIWATDSLHGTLSGVGNIRYRGNPTVTVSRIGVGNVIPLR